MIKDLAEQEKKYTKMDFPLTIAVEVGNHCNLNCIMCCNDSLKRKRGYMDMNLYRKIIDEIAEKSPGTRVWLDFYGEPLLVRYQLYFMIDYAKKRGIRNVNMNTNGTLLNEEMANMILDSGLDFLSADIDGFSKEVYESIRRGGDRDVVYRNIENFIEIQKRRGIKTPYFEIKVIEMEENKHEVQQIVDYWLDKGIGVGVRMMHNWGGNLRGVPYRNIEQSRIACGNAVGQLGVTWEGEVTMCAQDIEGELSLGNLNHESISQVWEKKQELIDLHMEHRFEELPEFCRKCSTWALVNSEEHYYSNGEKYLRSYNFDETMVEQGR